jgi:hypothetical protein
MRTYDQHLACLRGEACDSERRHSHCPNCTAYHEAWRTLHRALGLQPHEASPIDAHDGDHRQDGTGYAASWPRAQELRRELAKAAGITA